MNEKKYTAEEIWAIIDEVYYDRDVGDDIHDFYWALSERFIQGEEPVNSDSCEGCPFWDKKNSECKFIGGGCV